MKHHWQCIGKLQREFQVLFQATEQLPLIIQVDHLAMEEVVFPIMDMEAAALSPTLEEAIIVDSITCLVLVQDGPMEEVEDTMQLFQHGSNLSGFIGSLW